MKGGDTSDNSPEMKVIHSFLTVSTSINRLRVFGITFNDFVFLIFFLRRNSLSVTWKQVAPWTIKMNWTYRWLLIHWALAQQPTKRNRSNNSSRDAKPNLIRLAKKIVHSISIVATPRIRHRDIPLWHIYRNCNNVALLFIVTFLWIFE